MHVRALPVIALVGLSLTGIAVYERAWIQETIGGGGKHGAHLAYGFDWPVLTTDLVTARDLIADRLGTTASVRVDGGKILIDTEPGVDVIGVMETIDADLAQRPRLDLHVVDYASDYLEALAKHTRTAKAATDLGITAELDEIGRYLRVPDDGKYVNEVWANHHGCELKGRLPGTGVYCWVDPADRIGAYFGGDPALFVDPLPPELALPADRTWLPDKLAADPSTQKYQGKGAWKYYLVEADPIVLDRTTIADVTRAGDQLLVVLTPRGAAQIKRRASASTVELVTAIDGRVKQAYVKSGPGGQVGILINAEPWFGVELRHALSIAALPGRLHSLPDP